MATSDSKEGESTSTCSTPSVMKSPKQVNALDDQAQVTAESCSSAVGSVSSAAESCRSEASQEGSAAGCEEAMESAETACCVAMEVAEEVLRDFLEEKRNNLEGSISNMVAGLSALKVTGRSKSIRKIVFMSNDLEDIENNITRVLAVIQSWKEVCHNQKKTVIPGSGNVGLLCADSPVPETVSVPSTSGHTNGNINAVSVAGVSMPSAVSVPGASVSGASVQCDKAAESTNMAAPLNNKTVCDAAVRENVAGKSSVTEGAGNPPVNSESEEAQGRRGVWEGKRLFEDVMVWLKRQCTVLSPLTPLYDEEGFWIGGWKVQVKLHMNFPFPNTFPIPSLLVRTGGFASIPVNPGHFAAKCPVVKCALCGETGHPSKECQEIHCNLCLKLGYAHRSCHDSRHNIVRDCPNLQEEFSQGMEIVEEGAPTSEVAGSEREVVQPESSAPCSKVVGRAAGKLPKEKGEQRASQPRREEKWTVVGKKASIKKKDTSSKIVVATGNRFVLPEGKSWGDLAEEERLMEEERERKARALGKRNRKRKQETGKREKKGEESGGARQKQNRI
ncbi:hypothetical protein XELAEV_18004528mg [Xenopus laevis]|uniref:CCHC-type domain-containing protein n=1 Tax=Xenopus laevis TaxID=8355 RepID=A0A974BRA1_XENLA|nr:hypothetical protein XELAEV_18004528mg [Xenopus laevis]